MKCAITECEQAADPNGGALCVEHQRWTAGFMRRCILAIEIAITDEDGLDGLAGERLLREIGKWPPREMGPAPSRAEAWPCSFSHHVHATREEAVACAAQRR